MNKNSVDLPLSLVPAAQYVRMSDEGQQYSIENQKAAIQEYAACHGFVLVKTYADAGKSGVIAKNRKALRQLLKDVVSGEAEYKAILVYDINRWGRFQNNDEGAYYEFQCYRSGVPLHYCAEEFANDGTASSSIMKALKRSMAAEFSRELSEKVFRGKSRIVRLGFWVGGKAGCGYRRLMVSADGKRKQLLKDGEHKSLTTDRVILVLGPRKEVELVRKIFSMAQEGIGCSEIAYQLNGRCIPRPNGKQWRPCDVRNIVTNPKYAGLPRRADHLWSNEKIFRKLRRLLAKKGRLSISLIATTPGMPSGRTLRKRFGNYRDLYKAIGYQTPYEDLCGNRDAGCSMFLRRKLVSRIKEMFPDNVKITHLPTGSRSILLIDDSFMVSVLVCPLQQPRRWAPFWLVQPNPAERGLITVLCKLDSSCKRILCYYLFPRVVMSGKTHASYKNDPWLRTGTKLTSLAEFYEVVKRVRAQLMTQDEPSFHLVRGG